MRKNRSDSHIQNCPLDRQPGTLQCVDLDEESIGIEGVSQNLLNNHRPNQDNLTQHFLFNSLILTLQMSLWIALEKHSQLTDMWARSGYVLQQLVRDYFGYVVVAGLIYSWFDRGNFKWRNVATLGELCKTKPSYILLYLFTFTSSVFMLISNQMFPEGEFGEMFFNARWCTNFTSWYSMIGGFLVGFGGHILQKLTKFQHNRFAYFQLTQPHQELCGPVETQTFLGYIPGMLATMWPFYSFFESVVILYDNNKYPEMLGPMNSPSHDKFHGAEKITWVAAFGLAIGLIFGPLLQYMRHKKKIGIYTADNILLIGIAFFLAYHGNPLFGYHLLGIEFIIIVAIGIIACIYGYVLSQYPG
jgi:hypothetical protein